MVKQKYSHGMHNINDYFKKIERVIRGKKITELDILNIDKIDSRTGCKKHD